MSNESTNRRPDTGRIVTLVVLTVAAFLWLVPMLWVLAMSLKPNEVLMHTTAGLLPVPFTLDNFIQIFDTAKVTRWFLNSVGVAVLMTSITLVLSSLGGYALARIPFRGARFMLIFIIAGLTVPEQAVFIPLDTMFASWHMNNTIIALVTPRLAVPFGVFLMMQFFKAVPKELEEAAILDNASRLTIFFKVMLPLARPALTTLGIFTFLYSWNDYLWPLVSATQENHYTITTGLASLQGNFAQSEGLGFLMATAVFASAPVLIVYLIFQRYIVRGIAMSSGK
ncbi:MAG: carbohydrate ABC transporter permease [Salinisphaera sp.]|jgi:multiple sugar transport system permease protein|nr:carbohydrate ABC transporter permease [Salinisphaera sp.]